MMEALYSLRKYFSRVGFLVLILQTLALVSLCAATVNSRNKERFLFSCQSVTHLRDYCLMRYDEQYTPLPLYGFVLLCFVPAVLMCIIYSCLVKSRVDELETARGADPRRRPRLAFRRVFRCYFLNLLLRSIWGIWCAVLQKSHLYPAGFPAEFACVTPIVKPTVHSTNSNSAEDYSSFAIHNCNNSVASEKEDYAIVIFWVNVLLVLLVFVEMCYLFVRALHSKEFSWDSEFCGKHFWNKESYSLTLRQAIFLMMEKILRETESIEPLIAESDDTHKVDDNFVDLVIYTRRAEIFDVNLKPEHGSVAIDTVRELFLPNEDTQTPRKILVVGRPGIGKTFLCAKISREWGKNDLLRAFHLFYFIQFGWFNNETLEKISLKELLGRSHPEGSNDELIQYIFDKPENVLIVFDGLDEFKCHSPCLEEKELYGVNSATKKMHLSTLYVKLVEGKLLPGATILTTSRSDTVQSIAHLTALPFDRKVEIMGFTPMKILEYVQQRFAYDDERADRIWHHISSNLELLSLCYIPLNTCIFCTLLEECLKLQEQNLTHMALPSTSTTIWKVALKLFIFKHHSEFKGTPLTQDFLLRSDDFLDTVRVTLNRAGALAIKGIEEGRLAFDSYEVQGMENCGLFHRMQNRNISIFKFQTQYCFLHLTFQEFLAAREIAKMNPGELKSFVRRNASDPKWHLVLQFVAGLLGDERNKAASIFVNILCDSMNKSEPTHKHWRMVLLMMKCLHEYNDEATVKQAASEIQRSIPFDKKIDLCACNVTAPDCAAIVYLIKHLHGNIALLLGINDVKDQGVPYLCAAIKDEHCKLTKLNLAHNRISDQGVSHLCAALKDEHCQLTKLNLAHNKISNQGVSHLCTALKDEHCKLTKLNLAHNRISDQGVSHLCAALKDEHCQLTKLNLAHNKISNQGVSHLCAALKDENCKLTKLDLSSIHISDQGVSQLCAALKNEHCQLTKLNLARNKISDQGVSHLCAALKDEHGKLKTLDFEGNNISDQGVSHLCAALKD